MHYRERTTGSRSKVIVRLGSAHGVVTDDYPGYRKGVYVRSREKVGSIKAASLQVQFPVQGSQFPCTGKELLRTENWKRRTRLNPRLLPDAAR